MGTLKSIYRDWLDGNLGSKAPGPDIVERFSAKRQVADLRVLFEHITATRNGSTAGSGASLLNTDWP